MYVSTIVIPRISLVSIQRSGRTFMHLPEIQSSLHVSKGECGAVVT